MRDNSDLADVFSAYLVTIDMMAGVKLLFVDAKGSELHTSLHPVLPSLPYIGQWLRVLKSLL